MTSPRKHHGKLFDNREKRKPSQPDMQGDGVVNDLRFSITAWKREDQLVLSLAQPRKGSNQLPPEEFRGALDATGARDPGAPVWAGEMAGEGGTFTVRAFSQAGKSGTYLRLELEAV